MRVLLGISGGIAAYKSAELVRRLRSRGHEVRCALTRSAVSFVAPLTLEVLSGHRVYQEEYLAATGSGEEAHIAAAAWTEVLCLAPATTHLLARLALGLGDDFLTTTALAFAGPVVAAPAMHSVMWAQEATRQHVATLARRGVRFAGPVEGALAPGGGARPPAGPCGSAPAPLSSRSTPSASLATGRAARWASPSLPRPRGGAPERCWSPGRCRCPPRRASPASTWSPRGRWRAPSTSTLPRPT